jgi:hypothetical protein
MHEERKGKCLRQVEHIRGHLTDRHDIAEILLKAALNTLTLLFVSLLYTMGDKQPSIKGIDEAVVISIAAKASGST